MNMLRFALIFSLGLLGACKVGLENDGEWVRISPGQSVFEFPLAEQNTDRASFTRNHSELDQETTEVGIWKSDDVDYDQAVAIYRKLAPNYHIPERERIESAVRQLAIARDYRLVFEPGDSEAREASFNGRGSFWSRRFSFDNVQCVGFEHFWGLNRSGREQLYGYYCGRPGQALGEETVTALQRDVSVDTD